MRTALAPRHVRLPKSRIRRLDGDGRPGRYVSVRRPSLARGRLRGRGRAFAECHGAVASSGRRSASGSSHVDGVGVTRRCVETTRRSEWRASGVSAAQISGEADCCGSVAPWPASRTGLEQHTNASQTVRAISLLYALTGSFECARRQRPSDPAARHDLARSRCCRGPARKGARTGERPLGSRGTAGSSPPTSTAPSWTARPTVCAAMVGFGGNMLVSRPARRPPAPRSHGSTSSCGADLFPDAHGCARRRGAAGVVGVEREGLRRRVRADARGRDADPAAPRGGRATRGGCARIPGSPASWRAASVSARNSSRRRGRGPSLHAGALGVTVDCARANPRGVRVPAEVRLPAPCGAPRRTASQVRDAPAGGWRSTHAVLEHGYAPLPEYVEPAVSPVSRAASPPAIPRAHQRQVVQSATASSQSPRLRRIARSRWSSCTLPPRRPGIVDGDWVVSRRAATMRARAKAERDAGARRDWGSVRLAGGELQRSHRPGRLPIRSAARGAPLSPVRGAKDGSVIPAP